MQRACLREGGEFVEKKNYGASSPNLVKNGRGNGGAGPILLQRRRRFSFWRPKYKLVAKLASPQRCCKRGRNKESERWRGSNIHHVCKFTRASERELVAFCSRPPAPRRRGNKTTDKSAARAVAEKPPPKNALAIPGRRIFLRVFFAQEL